MIRWFREKTELLPNCKYTLSDGPATVKDIFHGKKIKLDGYRALLNISGLTHEDFTNYTVRLSSGSMFVEHTIVLAPLSTY